MVDILKKLYPDSTSIKSALQLLRKEIDLCSELKTKVSQAGPMNKHTFNFVQVRLILEHFSITPEDYNQL